LVMKKKALGGMFMRVPKLKKLLLSHREITRPENRKGNPKHREKKG